jgi:cation-transporting ATPase F
VAESQKPWWTKEATDVLADLGSGHHGLDESEARRRLSTFGPNTIQEAGGIGPLEIFINQFKSPLIYILLLSAVLTAALGEYGDMSIIVAVLVLNATVGTFQEHRAERALQALRQLTAPKSTVLRGGTDREVDSHSLVPGDILLLQSGSKVPADGRIIRATGPQVDESLLTGESTVVDKVANVLPDPALPLADRANMAYMGSVVTRGRAHAVVTATGMATELGRIAGEIWETEQPASPLQRRMAQFARIIGVAIVIVCAVVFPLGVGVGESVTTMLRTVIALIVAAIPEGLPVALTLALAIGVNRMARRHAIVRGLPAVETLGSCTVIGSDKTGTLTENRMTVQAIYAAGELYRVTGTGYELDGRIELNGAQVRPRPSSPLHWLLVAGALNNEASLYRTDGDVDVRADPTEIALLVAAAKAGVFKGGAEEVFPRAGEIPFEPERRFSASYHQHGESGHILFVKGAPERVLAMCTAAEGRDGPTTLDPAEVMAVSDRLGGEGLRMLAMAYGQTDHRIALDAEEGPSDLTFLGLVGMMDPPRPGVPEAVAACQSAGIRVLMLTGDHRSTAVAVAGKVGIQTGDDVIEGRHIERLSDEDLEMLVSRASVFARVEPHHKLRIVQALQRQGNVAAVTGDGVNDAPALRAADIGVAMGLRGTDVAKEASNIIVTDDNFATIVAAVEEGRVVFDNVRKVTFFLLSTGIAVVIAVFVSIVGGFPLPLLPAQIIWVNLVTNGIQVGALAFEPGERDTLQKPPRPPNEGILSPILWERTALVGTVIAAATLAFFLTEFYLADSSLEQARTMALTTMVMFQAIHVGNARSEHLSAFRKSPFSNPFLFVGTIAALSVQAGALYFWPTQTLLDVEPLTLSEWLRIAAASVSIVLVVEMHKLVRRPRHSP